MADAKQRRVLSGVQPSGALHLGNYFGAMRRHIALQDEAECFYFIADYHALTTVRDAKLLRDYSFDVAVSYLAVGLDPARTVFYRQSDVPEVCELTWILETVTSMGLLEKAHSYKEKVSRGITPSVGLFGYPVLMAADILGPQAHVVPVGQDQDQHVQMTRDMAQAFHHAFGVDDLFTLPEASMGEVPRVPGTTFEKGQVLQINTTVDPGVEVEDYVAGLRALVTELFEQAAEGELQDTEAVRRALKTAQKERFPEVSVHDLTLRTTLQNPGERIVTTDRDGRRGLEFYVPVDRMVFVTHDGLRQAAKMSKSYGNTIPLFEQGKPLKKKVMGIETRLVELEDPLDHTEDLVFQLYSLFADDSETAEMRANYEAGGFGFGNAKKALLAKVDAHFAPFRERREQLLANPDEVEDVLRDGAKRAREVIGATVDRAREICGLGSGR